MTGASYLVDTNTVSFIMDGRSIKARDTFEARVLDSRIYISVITEAEILFGLAKQPWVTRRRNAFRAFICHVNVLPWDSAAAQSSAAMRVAMSTRGRALQTLDMLIAAHALATDAILVTHDMAFAHAGTSLQLEDWATDLPS